MTRFAPVLLLLTACSGVAPEPGGSADQEAYRRSMALAETDATAAAEACGQIVDTALSDECLLFAARAQAKGQGDAVGLCARMGAEQTRGACVLEVVDAQAITGDAAVAACQTAGPMQERCLSHAIQRELSREANRYPLGEEQAFEAWVQGRVVAMGLQSTRPDYAGEQCARLIARRRSRHGPPAPFTRAECGTASDTVCQEAYRVIIRERTQGSQVATQVCAETVTRESVAAAGLPPWGDEVAALAEAVWEQTCKESRRQR